MQRARTAQRRPKNESIDCIGVSARRVHAHGERDEDEDLHHASPIMQGYGGPRHQACLHWDCLNALPKGPVMDISNVLLKVMALYKHSQTIERAVSDLLNEVQMMVTTRAEAKEIEIEEK